MEQALDGIPKLHERAKHVAVTAIANTIPAGTRRSISTIYLPSQKPSRARLWSEKKAAAHISATTFRTRTQTFGSFNLVVRKGARRRDAGARASP